MTAKNLKKELFGRNDYQKDIFADLEIDIPFVRPYCGGNALFNKLHTFAINYTFIFISYR
jgi:hypothetical protein